MPKNALRLALFLTFAPLLAGTLMAANLASAPADLVDLLDDNLARAKNQAPSEIWQGATSLRQAATAMSQGDDLDSALDERLGNTGALAPSQILFASAARIIGGATDLVALQEDLAPLLAGANSAVAIAAAELLGNEAFIGLGSEEREELAALLQDVADDGNQTPELRIAAATSCYKVGRGKHKIKARARMSAFLGSEDASLRALGALALAGIGNPIRGELEDELTYIASLPGDDGRLATSFLKLGATRSLHEAKYSKLKNLYNSERTPENLKRVASLLEMINDGHLEGDRLEEEELVDAALNGMLGALDRHSSYMPAESYKQFSMDLLESDYGGIGAYVRNDPVDNIFTITRPIYSGPAYKAGLATDDKIVQIDDWPTIGNEQEEIIKRLKGKPATMVKLYIWRRGMDPGKITRPTEDMVVEIERAQISVPSTAHQMLPGKIGLVELKSFSRTATADVLAAIEELKADGMRALVFDLRYNSGGLLTEARGVSDLFLPKGLDVVSTEARVGQSQTLGTLQDAAIPADMPMICLINRYSASASEIVSGALQDHKRATIVGERSFGKGSVQNLFPLYGYADDQYTDENGNRKWDSWEPLDYDFNGNGEFDFAPHVRLTIARYLLPSGRSIHREFDDEKNLISPGGVEPDQEAEAGLIEGWRVVERRKLLDQQVPRGYVDQYWDANHEDFRLMAICDEKDTSRYPGFEKFYADLGTPLVRDDVRILLRAEIRRRMQDERGGAYPLGDFEEDTQLQSGLTTLLEALGESTDVHKEYKTTFIASDADAPEIVASAELPQAEIDAIASAKQRLIAARDGGEQLGGEDLKGLIELLDSLEL
ncbi:MAG: S41 family peptidase [Planctomycetota bacterium]|nr:S41 family peptidase [Planctomycetota bacterium]MDG2143706.1 S41 family peptidase [Planctomycetota bacterium]